MKRREVFRTAGSCWVAFCQPSDLGLGFTKNQAIYVSRRWVKVRPSCGPCQVLVEPFCDASCVCLRGGPSVLTPVSVSFQFHLWSIHCPLVEGHSSASKVREHPMIHSWGSSGARVGAEGWLQVAEAEEKTPQWEDSPSSIPGYQLTPKTPTPIPHPCPRGLWHLQPLWSCSSGEML